MQNPEDLPKVIEAMFIAAQSGDVQAATFLRDSSDGKPQQQVSIDSDDGKPLFQAIKMVVISNQIKDLAEVRGVQSLGESSQDERVTLPRSVIPETHPTLNEVSPVSKVEANIPVSQLPVDFDANSV